MKKILFVSHTEQKSFLFRIAERLFLSESIVCSSGEEVEKIIKAETPDYVLLDDIKPVNGEDMMSTLRHIDGNIRLRVAIFYLGYSKRRLLKFKPDLVLTLKSR